MITKNLKKCLSVVLAVAMVATLLPNIAMKPTTVKAATYIGNNGYVYAKDMSESGITLVCEASGSGITYQWQKCATEDGTYENISEATSATYTFAPTQGTWYRCIAGGTASRAIMAIRPGGDGRSWTKPRHESSTLWYVGNGTMAYTVSGNVFDITGLYNKNGNSYMLQTVYGGNGWAMFTSTADTPNAGSGSAAQLDALKISFDSKDPFATFFEADLKDGMRAFSFGCDTQLGNGATSGNYSDAAALIAVMNGEQLSQISMIGAASLEEAADEDPAFVIAPADGSNPMFWIGEYDSRKTFSYNVASRTIDGITTSIGGKNVYTSILRTDSGMTMSWTNVPSGGSIKFRFGVGDVASTGAVPKAKAEAGPESITVTGVNGTLYYRLYTEDGTPISEWTNEPTEDDYILYTGLEPDKKYVVKTVEAENYDPVSGNITNPDEIGEAEIYTAIKIAETAVVTPTSHTLTITGLDSTEYYYYAIDEDGNESAATLAKDGTVVIEGLSAHKNYTIKAKSDVNDNSTSIEGTTLIEVTFNMMGHGEQVPAISDLPLNTENTITEPEKPEDADEMSFVAWYKESSLTNEFDFDNDKITENTTLYAKWVPHVHNWQYRLSDDKIEAFCIEPVAKCSYYGTSFDDAANIVSSTISADNMMYNDNPYNKASITTDIYNITGKTFTKYYEGTGDTTYDKSTTAPTNVGTYKVSVEEDGMVASDAFEIETATQEATVSTNNFVFNGTNVSTPSTSNVLDEENVGITYYYNEVNSNVGGKPWSELTTKTLHIGTYYVYAQLEGTNNVYTYTTPTSTFKVTPAIMDLDVNGYNEQYDGAGHGISVDLVGFDDEVVSYSTTGAEGTYTTEKPTYIIPGTYTVYYKVEREDFTTRTGSAKVIITKREISVSGIKAVDRNYNAKKDVELAYGDVEFGGIVEGDELTVTATGKMENKLVGEAKNVAITNIALGGEDASLYKLADEQQTEATVNISKKPITITATAKNRYYDGTTDIEVSGTPDDVEEGDAVSVVGGIGTVETMDAAEDKVVTIKGMSFEGSDADNYELVEQPSTVVTVIPKKITVTAEDKTKVYGEENPENTFTAPKKVGEDVIDVIYSREEGENVGEYVITPLQEEGKNPNYDITFETAKLTITQKPITVTAEDKVKTYGDEDPEFTFQAPDIVGEDELAVNMVRTEGENVGEYVITPSQEEGANGNYDITFENGKFVIEKKAATVVIKDAESIYDSEDAELKYELEGMVGEEILEGVTLEREPGVDVGTYKITGKVDAEKNPNYEVAVKDAAYTIKPANAAEGGKVQLSTTKYDYNGKERKPKTTVTWKDKTLIKGKDYTVTYENNVESGTAKVIIKGIGNYDFTMEKTFKISDNIAKNSEKISAGMKTSFSNNGINVKWGKVKTADGYEIYLVDCGKKKFGKKPVKVVTDGNKATISKIGKKSINMDKHVKLYVKAFRKVNGKKVYISKKTVTVHIAAKNSDKYTNAKAITVKKSKFSLKAGKTAKIKAKITMYDSNKIALGHTKTFRYTTSNKKVAKADGNGIITAVAPGNCFIYVFSENGLCKKIKVSVK